jgi:hypothetical protein
MLKTIHVRESSDAATRKAERIVHELQRVKTNRLIPENAQQFVSP